MKKTRKGFTLIELLAVIVVLAVIALIATPIVLNLIDKSKVGAAEASATSYVKSLENTVIKDMLYSKDYEDKTYEVGEIEANVKGTTPTEGNFTLEKGQVTRADLCINNYRVVYEDNKATRNGTCDEIETTSKVCTLKSGEALAIGSEYDCTVAEGETKTFYVLEVTEDNVSLIMNQNIDNTTVAWSADQSNHKDDSEDMQAVDPKAKLPTTWANVDEVALPTAEQIANASGFTAWTVSNYVSTILPNWLYGYLGETYAIGYWTSTTDPSTTNSVWYVRSNGHLYNNGIVHYSNVCGVRPVITVSKSKI